MDYCERVLKQPEEETTELLELPQSKWNPAVTISWHDCHLIMSKTGVREELRQRYDNDPRHVEQPQPPPGKHIPGC